MMRRRRAFHAAALFALLLGSCGAEVAAPPRGEVGVAAFAANRADGAAIPDVATSLAAKLGALGVGSVLPPRAIGAWPATPSTAARIALRDRTGARTLVTGGATRVGQALALDARVIDLDSGVPLGPPLIENAANDADLQRALDALAQQVARRILEPPPTTLAADPAKKPRKSKPATDVAREPIEIQADTLDAQAVSGGRRLTFTGHVSAMQGEITLACDGLEAFYPTGASEPDQLVAKGNIRVTQRDRTATCSEAIFYRSEDKLVCTGNPAELTEECSRAEAEKFTFYLETEKVEMVRPKVHGRECAATSALPSPAP